MRTNKLGGRPKKSAVEKLKHRVSFMLPTTDYYALKARANSAGLSLAEIARRAVIGSRIIPRLTPEESAYIRQLSGMASNLNQIARAANSGGYPIIKKQMEVLADEIRNIRDLFKYDSKNYYG